MRIHYRPFASLPLPRATRQWAAHFSFRRLRFGDALSFLSGRSPPLLPIAKPMDFHFSIRIQKEALNCHRSALRREERKEIYPLPAFKIPRTGRIHRTEAHQEFPAPEDHAQGGPYKQPGLQGCFPARTSCPTSPTDRGTHRSKKVAGLRCGRWCPAA